MVPRSTPRRTGWLGSTNAGTLCSSPSRNTAATITWRWAVRRTLSCEKPAQWSSSRLVRCVCVCVCVCMCIGWVCCCCGNSVGGFSRACEVFHLVASHWISRFLPQISISIPLGYTLLCTHTHTHTHTHMHACMHTHFCPRALSRPA
jgi:hypothetical protein